MEQLYIFMKSEDFEDSELHCFQRGVRVDVNGYKEHVFEDI